MALRLLSIIYSLLFYYLPPNDATTTIVLPDKDADSQLFEQCVTTNSTCQYYLTNIQSYAIYVLEVERFLVSKGGIYKMPVATNLLRLELDPDRQYNAQRYAEECVRTDGMEKCSVSGLNDDGEVIIFITKYNMNTLKSTPRKFAKYRAAVEMMAWSQKLSNINSQDIIDMIASYSTAPKDETLEYIAKLFHASAWKVGCGIADRFINDYEFKEVVACFFGPPKLQDGEVLYAPGCAPCINCPGGTTCNKDRTRPTAAMLCKPESSDMNFPPNFELPSGKVCRKIEEVVPSDAMLVPLHAAENSVQECRGELLCSPSWEHSGEISSIHVRQRCTSAVTFRDRIHIPSESCFQLFYKKTGTTESDSEVVALAFQVDDVDRRIKVVRNEAGGHFMYLNIPWTGVDINVGFGTRSLSDYNNYEVVVKNLLVSSGRCPV